jgi:EmrB/QacA subfamily drug resistance transporter
MTTAAENDRSRWLALYVLCGGVLMIVLDVTFVNVALPSIQDSLGFSQSNLAWVVNAYLIPFGGLLLLAGRMGDLLGQRRIFLGGLVVFIAASLLCAAAESQAMLIAGRFFAGVGGAFASAVVLGMIVTMFPEPREQAKAIGVFGFVASAGGSIGLLAGGALTQAISWHWIFLINLPIGIGVALGAQRLVPSTPGIGLKAGADVPGAALVTGSLMIGTYGILGVSEHGWGSTQTLILSLVSAALFAAFLVRQARIDNPLVPLGLFRDRNLSGANVIQALLVAGMFGMFFLGALYLQRILGYDALEVGLAFLPTTVAMGTLSLGFSEKLIMRFGPRTTLIPGVAMIGVGLLLFARTPVDGDYLTDLLPPLLLVGVGVGTSFPSLMTLAMSGASPSEAGLASGVVNTSMQVGGAIGLAVLATLAEQRADDLTSPGAKVGHAALNSGYHLAYVIGAALVAIALVVAVTVLRQPSPEEMAEMAAAHGPGEDEGGHVEAGREEREPAYEAG